MLRKLDHSKLGTSKNYVFIFMFVTSLLFLYNLLVSYSSLQFDAYSFAPLKSAIDEMINRWSDALTLSLRKSAGRDFKEMDTWLTASMEKLGSAPQSVSSPQHSFVRELVFVCNHIVLSVYFMMISILVLLL